MPTHAYVGCPVGCPDGNWRCPGEWLGPGEGSPLIDVLADVESGVWVGAVPIIQHQYEALAIQMVAS